LPSEKREFPEPLPAGKEPGFKLRGTKGWLWTPEQYLAEIPVIAQYKMNFLMNCYGSMFDIEHYKFGDPQCNRWWEDFSPEKKTAYENVVKECQKRDIKFCFSMNPNLTSKRILKYDSTEDVDILWKHYAWMQGLGVKWFNISLDDITEGINAPGQVKVVNEIFRRLRDKDPESQMIFCPTFYWADGTDKDAKPYLEILAKDLHKDVYVFWTGDAVVGPITRKGTETYKGIVKHRMFLWDNYPVNDGHQTLHLAPVIDRESNLCDVIDGYMSNPLHTQNEANRLPMLTCADYAYNPWAYDPNRSIGQAILHLADRPEQQKVLRDLVEAYPGFLINGGGGTGYNAIRNQFAKIASTPNSVFEAQALLGSLDALSVRLDKEFPDTHKPTKETVSNDVKYLRDQFTQRYGRPAP